MKKRKELEENFKTMAKRAAKEWKEANPEIAEKIDDLRGKIIDCLPDNPDEFISFEELCKALKPSKIVCATRKKFAPKTEESAEKSPCQKKCGGCSSSCGGSDKCACAESDNLCSLCKQFLYNIITQIMAPLGDVELYPYEETFYLGHSQK